MDPGLTAAGLVQDLAARHRVVVLGGRAVVFHGHPQPVHDFDVWLDPALELNVWCGVVWHLTEGCEGVEWVCPTNWVPISRSQIVVSVAEIGMVRLTGADSVLDVIRRPDCPRTPPFDEVWTRAMPMDDGTRMPAALDLLHTIPETDREIYQQEFVFLENRVEAEYRQTLPGADEATAIRMLEQYISPEAARIGSAHASVAVRDFCLRYLLEQSDAGNPFATDLLFEWH
jgi:hypothetical protein